MSSSSGSEVSTRTVITFFVNGIASLLGWNAVLSSLDYFAYVYDKHDIYSYFPLPLFVGYVVVGSTFHILSTKFRYWHLILSGLIIVNVALALLLFTSALSSQDNQDIGFYISLLLCFVIGVGGNLSQLSFFAMINYLSQGVVSKFTVGTAVSGLLLTVLRMIIVAIAGSDNSNVVPVVIFFALAIGVLCFDAYLNYAFCNSQEYRTLIQPFVTKTTKTINPLDQNIVSSIKTEDQVSENQQIEKQNYFKTLYQTMIAINPYPLFIMFTFVITFMLFPGPSLKKTFKDLSITWSSLIILLMYNIGDTVGKYLGDIKNSFNHHSTMYVFFARLFFFLTIPIMANGAADDDILINNYIFPFFNQLLFGLTNGFVINCSFILCFMTCPPKYKKYAGVLGGLILQIGIMIGTALEIPFAMIAL